MQRYNYSHSEYMLPNESHTVEEMVENAEYARFLHYADIFRYKMAELENAGLLDTVFSIRCLAALQDAQYSGSFIRVMAYDHMLEQAIARLPTN